jgi:hypothetical protein
MKDAPAEGVEPSRAALETAMLAVTSRRFEVSMTRERPAGHAKSRPIPVRMGGASTRERYLCHLTEASSRS